MAWTSQLAGQIDGRIRARGVDYFRRGAVKRLSGDAWSADATVQGTEPYHVHLERNASVLKVSCTCPYLVDNLDPCKHVWATLLAAEARGLLKGADGKSPRSLIVDEEALDVADDEYDYEDEGFDDGEVLAYRRYTDLPRPAPKMRPPKPPDWKQSLAALRGDMERQEGTPSSNLPAGRQVVYVVDVSSSKQHGELVLETAFRSRKKDGEWGKPKSERLNPQQIHQLPDPADRQILSMLAGARDSNGYGYGYGYSYYPSGPARHRLPEDLQDVLLPSACATGRCFLRPTPENADLLPLRWDDGPPWEFWLKVELEASGKRYQISGELRRGDERHDLTSPLLLVAGGLVFWDDHAARLDDFGAFQWVSLLRERGTLTVPAGQKEDLIRELLRLPRLPRLDLPEELRFEETPVTPRPRLKVRPPTHKPLWGGPERLLGELSFDYEGTVVPANEPGRGTYQPERRRLIPRDPAAEDAAAARLQQLGFRRPSYGPNRDLELAPRNLPKVVRDLLEAGWFVEAEGKIYRQPGAIRVEVRSGIDWFELDGGARFGDVEASLPELLAALRKGENTVRLGDGTYGLLPEEWLKKYGTLAGLGTAEGTTLRFRPSQVGLLDALLATQPEAKWDEGFAQARDRLQRFTGVEPIDPPAGFIGQLRAYQREGLGWLHFLQQFGFGGCLADDMGLGKTVQVLALLESRRESRERGGKDSPPPSLVVVPRSLIFNWIQEAARFTPKLRVLDHSGVGRAKPGEHFHDYDVILTTYGTLRRDALGLKDFVFDYCILDEAQAIKNAKSESAKAARLMQATHHLALSGTPIENHLGELWSLFEFLNPGMLGSASVFQLVGDSRQPGAEGRDLLARALRPFILRRTKGQVAADLPPKQEETIWCEMEPAQRKRYNELRAHYRQSLLARVERDGINRSKIQILEALLRLRQAACHPGLIDKDKTGEPSAKLDALMPQLAEVIDESHKCLVFSQFTSFLCIVRDRLDGDAVPYEYLDGRTRDRQAKVDRFQSDPDCKLFLISLKAGGQGLNLTAAEYVFLLDPWWNPAVEAQAIDRAHRIGQTNSVFAYRLVARDTVEEKVLELQKTKRALADAIINADNSLIRGLGREDLELLLS
jgi:superfamily II DNA or RNA helicase